MGRKVLKDNEFMHWGNTKKKVPKTRRYCLVCEKITTFEYNPRIGHSRCVNCCGWLCRNLEPGGKHETEKKDNDVH